MPDIKLKNLRKSYGTYTAIHEIDLTIPDGSFCVFLGPSGCGKSTTLNCIAGLEDVTSGQILMGDRDVTDLPPYQRDIAMVFQSSLLYPHLTALQNIKMSLRGLKGQSAERDKRISDAVSMLNIGKLLDKKPARMSGGERQRVAMAKAIVRNPAAFLMDEPLAALDAALRQSLRSDLVHLQKKLGVTTVFVTHDQVEAMTMGDLVIVMKDGKIEQAGTPQDIYERPATRFVAGFIGSPPMNFLAGEMTAIDGEPAFRTGSTVTALPKDRKWPGSGQSIEIGVRPQHLTLLHEPTDASIPATVYSIERLGKENVIVLEAENGNTIRVLTAPNVSPALGERLYTNVDKGGVHYFGG
jgi:ABC-type sugar transport system ATPase subunit